MREPTSVYAVLLLVEGQAAPGGQFLRAGRNDVVVEAGDEDVAVLVLELGQNLRQGHEGIGRRAAVHAGVQIGLGAAHFKLGVDHAAQAHAQGGQAGRKELGIGDQGKVRLQLGRLGGDKARNSLPSHLLFAFEQDAHVERQLAVGGQQRLQRLDLRPHLALVVHRAAGVEVAVALRRLEGRREPLVQRIGRLHIVVAVKEHGRLARGMQPVGIDQRMTVGFDQPHVLHADAGQLGGQRLGGAAAIALVLGQRGDGRNAQQVLQFIEKARDGSGGRKLRRTKTLACSFRKKFDRGEYRPRRPYAAAGGKSIRRQLKKIDGFGLPGFAGARQYS